MKLWLGLLALPFFISVTHAKSSSLTLIYSNDVYGEIEPCGCRRDPSGGMFRKALFLEKLTEKIGKPVDLKSFLQIDSGDLLFPANQISPSLVNQSKIQAEYLIQAMNLLEHTAVVPGEKDFALGLDTFLQLSKKAKFPFLAANLKRKNGSLLLKPFLKIHRNGLRVGILGLVGEKLDWPQSVKNLLKVDSVLSTAKKWVPQLRKEVDLVIVVTHQGLEEDQILAKKVKGIDILIGAHSQSYLQTPETEGKTWIYQSSFRNQAVGVLPLEKSFSNRGHQLVELEETLEKRKAGKKSREIRALVIRFKKAIQKLNEEEEKKNPQAKVSKSKTHYQTFPRCAECHVPQFDFWRKTAHTKALTPLLKENQIKNKECIECHSLAFGKEDAFQRFDQAAVLSNGDQPPLPISIEKMEKYLRDLHEAENLKKTIPIPLQKKHPQLQDGISLFDQSWVPVQCENCHTPGGNHPLEDGYRKTVPKKRCLSCHTPHRAPSWYKDNQPDWEKIAKKYESIRCPPQE